MLANAKSIHKTEAIQKRALRFMLKNNKDSLKRSGKPSTNLRSRSTYLLKVNNRNTRKRCEISSKLTIKIPERRQCRSVCLYY